MNCDQCGNKCDKKTTGSINGLVVTTPCHSSNAWLTFTCDGFTQKTTPVDPALTQDSVCGECNKFDCETYASGYCERLGENRHANYVACALFKPKPSDKPRLKAAECKHRFIMLDNLACRRTATACTQGDGDACEEMQGGGP